MTLYRLLNYGTAYGGFTVGKVYTGEALGIADDEKYLPVCVEPVGKLPSLAVHGPLSSLIGNLPRVYRFCDKWITFLLGPIGKDLADQQQFIDAALAVLRKVVPLMPDAPPLPDLRPAHTRHSLTGRSIVTLESYTVDDLKRLREWARAQLPKESKPERPVNAPTVDKGKLKVKTDARATALFLEDTKRTKTAIAKMLDVTTQALAPNKCPKLSQAMRIHKAPDQKRRIRGSKDKDGNLEAYEE